MRDKPIFTTDKLGYAEVLALKNLADWQDAALSVHLKKKNERIKELEDLLAKAYQELLILNYCDASDAPVTDCPSEWQIDNTELLKEIEVLLPSVLLSAKSAQAGV